MQALNLPACHPDVSREDGKSFIFDPLRRKKVALTPEEWVRQHFVNYLVTEKSYPAALLANEVTIALERLSRRCDTVVYSPCLEPLAIVEYKAPSVRVTQQVFEQIARYNLSLRVKCLMVTNGLEHYCCRIDYKKPDYAYLKEIPAYEALGRL
ncbi:MAG: type I restriction enzyme HsdR N-terminal domain-containing protein [Tannerella sp.]|nr:type I restriction enzyme HsdR N-terminal domain-containing protein [Tannerella sp.]